MQYRHATISAAITFALMLSLSMGAAHAEENEKPDFSKEKLTGNWGGTRDNLFARGLSFEIYYKNDVWRNFSGGTREGNRTLDNLDMTMTIDGEKAFNSPGTTLFLYVLNNNGGRPNDLAGTNGGIDNIEVSTRSFKLYEAWAEQNFWDDKVSVLAGVHDLNSEFYATDTSGLFLNPTYGIGTEMSATGDNGPSIFPYTGLAARIAFRPSDSTYLQGAVFDGVPGDTAHPRGTHLKLKDKEGALLVAEGGIRGETTGHFAVGAWEYTARRPDQVTSDISRRSKGFYFLADKSLYHYEDRDVSLFGRIGFTAGDVEQFANSWSAGIVFSGLIASRPKGQFGMALASSTNSVKYKTANAPVDSREMQLEVTYKDALTPWLSVQPDVQYTVNPGTDPALKNAWTAGVRFGIDF